MWVLFLIPACVTAALSCLRLVRLTTRADVLDALGPARPADAVGIGLYETAYLAGGPDRVVELALVLMAGRGRLHLAHTGWTTVVDPRGRTRLERALIEAIGPEGQCRTAGLRGTVAAHPVVREIGDRLASAGLATPETVRRGTVHAVRQVRRALLLCLLLLAAALAVSAPGTGDAGAATAWFALPLILTGGTPRRARAFFLRRRFDDMATPLATGALHPFHRSTPGGCTPADGALDRAGTRWHSREDRVYV
ncbi:TIGR04222 domain-containing membrane protein [Kitasatospora sp. NPDC059571]|uniref:TIGR04222 domain-containing membrane protein n=1 Tax=Kitasatospora sp. NPDC059571 TaxID=3346871 RepID=UPI0036BF5B11